MARTLAGQAPTFRLVKDNADAVGILSADGGAFAVARC